MASADSPFNKSDLTRRSPPPSSPIPQSNEVDSMSSAEIQTWMTGIENSLSEICSTVSQVKMLADQKIRISNLCRKVTHGTSQMAVMYQALTLKTAQALDSIKTLQDSNDMALRLSEVKLAIQESCNKPTSTQTYYADMVKKGSNNYICPSNTSSVAIYPKDQLKSSDDTTNLVKKIIIPEKIKLHVRGVRKTINGGVIISTDSKADIEKLKNTVQQSSSELVVDEPYKRRPRVIVIGVSASMPESEVLKCIYEQNLADKLPSLSLESFLSSIKLSHKSGKKDSETCNFIIEVPANIRKALIVQDRVFINWSSCPIRDFTLVTRCYNCQQYGHAAKSCRDSTPTCGHCACSGHSIKECAKKSATPKCASCLRFNKPSDHKTGDPDCPAKKMAELKYINSVNYGGA